MLNAKQSLAYIDARRNDLPLVRAAEKAFRRLGALYAAGIDPKLYHVHHMCGASVNTGLSLEYG
jgi:hypothetical protein